MFAWNSEASLHKRAYPLAEPLKNPARIDPDSLCNPLDVTVWTFDTPIVSYINNHSDPSIARVLLRSISRLLIGDTLWTLT